MTYLIAEVQALVNGQHLASRPAPRRTWRDRACEGSLQTQACLACNLGRVAADEILIDRLIAARQVQARIQGVA